MKKKSIPSIERIYNEYHKWTFYFSKGYFPKSIKNFQKAFEVEGRVDTLKKFQIFLQRNDQLVDWQIYIYSIARLTKTRYPLQYLGSLKGTKIYRDYINLTYNEEAEQQYIYDEIVRSLKNIGETLELYNVNFEQYFQVDSAIIPLSIKQLYSGTISPYFYAAFPKEFLAKTILSYQDDVYMEMFNIDKFTFIESSINRKRILMLKYNNVKSIVTKIEKLIF